jgi:uncharacterized lipoprotein YmbA
MKSPRKQSIRAFALVVLGTLACPACSLLSPPKDPTRFAVLASVDEMPGAARPGAPAPPSAVRVGLGPVTLPEYVRRSAIVSRIDGTRLVPSGTERWAEPLDRAVVRVLAIDLERTLGVGRIVNHPWYDSDRPDVQIEIAFSRCEREEPGQIVVAARWSVRHLSGDQPPIERESRIERKTNGPDGASTALALSQALADLCREIKSAWPARDGAGEDPPREVVP